MKTTQLTSMAIALLLSLNVKAQSLSSVGPISTISAKAAQLELDFFTLNLGSITDKFNDYASSKVLFDAKSIEIDIQKRAPKCGPNKVCVDMVLAPTSIKLNVVEIVRQPCSDVYYASSGAGGDINLVEQIRLEDFSVGRCEYAGLLAPESQLTYRVLENGNINKPERAAYIDFSMDSMLPTSTK